MLLQGVFFFENPVGKNRGKWAENADFAGAGGSISDLSHTVPGKCLSHFNICRDGLANPKNFWLAKCTPREG